MAAVEDTDALRDELKVEHNVGCHDRDRTWWLGRQKREKREQAPLPTDHGYTREIDDKTPLVDERAVDALLLARVHAKMTRDFDEADCTSSDLFTCAQEVVAPSAMFRSFTSKRGESLVDELGGPQLD